MEQILQKVEGSAARALRRVTSAVTWGQAITAEDKTDLCIFTAFQLVRGLRQRREIELMSDLYVRIMQLNTPVGAGRRAVAAYREKLRDFRTLEVTTTVNSGAILHLRVPRPATYAQVRSYPAAQAPSLPKPPAQGASRAPADQDSHPGPEHAQSRAGQS